MSLRFPVSDKKNRALAAAMEAMGIDEREIHERFISASSPGGQRANKTATGVWLDYRDIHIRFQASRYQALNRYHARCQLVEMIKEKQGIETNRLRLWRKRRKNKSRRMARSRIKYGKKDSLQRG